MDVKKVVQMVVALVALMVGKKVVDLVETSEQLRAYRMVALKVVSTVV